LDQRPVLTATGTFLQLTQTVPEQNFTGLRAPVKTNKVDFLMVLGRNFATMLQTFI
jgi:hypothetical protein